jgi:fatty acid hydroxylase domain-containing protein 2
MFMMMLDLYQWPGALMKYKVQADKNVPVNRADLMKAVRTALMNQFLVTLPLTICLAPVVSYLGMSFSAPLPTFGRIVFELIVFVLLEEVGFFYGHWYVI